MVVQKVVNLTLPVGSLQLINYTPASFDGCRINLPNITQDNQMGATITFIIANGQSLISASGPTGIFITRQGTNLIFNKSGGVSQITTGLTYLQNNGVLYNLVSMKNSAGVYGWMQI